MNRRTITIRNSPTLLGLFVGLVSAHSIILGVVLIVAPVWLLSVFGWSIRCHGFFFQQAGVFHILLGVFYAIEFHLYHHIRMLLIAKVSAVVFLTAHLVFTTPQPGVLLSNVIDAGMAMITAILWLRRNDVGPERQSDGSGNLHE